MWNLKSDGGGKSAGAGCTLTLQQKYTHGNCTHATAALATHAFHVCCSPHCLLALQYLQPELDVALALSTCSVCCSVSTGLPGMSSVMLIPFSWTRVHPSQPCCMQVLAGWVAESDSAVLVVVASAVRHLACSGHVKTAGGQLVPSACCKMRGLGPLPAGGQPWPALCALMAALGSHAGGNFVL